MTQIKQCVYRLNTHFISLKKRGEIILECIRSKDPEKMEVGKYLLHMNKLSFMPYEFSKNYMNYHISVYHDIDGYPFVYHGDKKLFFKKEWDDQKVKTYYKSLQLDQDELSPHRYLTSENRYPMEDSIIADLGAAEGNFSLDIIDSARKIYLFEGDKEWNIPLIKTFEKWKEKVEIVNLYIGNKKNGVLDKNYTTLDEYFRNLNVTYVKADIEGTEENMLIGGEYTFKNKIQQALICSYHLPSAEKKIIEYMNKYGFHYDVNSGYVLYDILHTKGPYVRRAVIYGSKNVL